MTYMFYDANTFDQNLGWCLSSTVNKNNAFSGSGCSSDSCGVTLSELCTTDAPTGAPTDMPTAKCDGACCDSASTVRVDVKRRVDAPGARIAHGLRRRRGALDRSTGAQGHRRARVVPFTLPKIGKGEGGG